jgi:hypothetical protein
MRYFVYGVLLAGAACAAPAVTMLALAVALVTYRMVA